MPTYNFKHRETGEVIEKLMTISAMEQWLVDNPDWHITFEQAPMLSDTVRQGLKKPAVEFRELLSHMKKRSKYSTINDW